MEFDFDTLRIQLYILAENCHSFRLVERGDTLHNVDFLKKIWSFTRRHVLAQDYSSYASNKCQL